MGEHSPAVAVWRLAGGLALVGALVLLVAYPLGELLAAAGGEDRRRAIEGLTTGRSLRAMGNTLWTSAVVTALVLTGATAAALVTERTPVLGRRWLRVGMLLPLLVPPYVSALSWGRAYGPAGITDALIGLEVPGIFGAPGVVAVIAVNAMPLAYVIVAAALASRSEPDLERAARASGASPATVLRTITLPLLRPALVAAGALVFVTSANSFGVPAVLGRPVGFSTVTTRIYEDLVLSADLVAFTRVLLLASSLVALAVVVVGITDAVVGLRLRGSRTGAPAGGGGAGAAVAGHRASRLPAAALWGYLLLAVGLPLCALVLVALTRAVGLPPTPEHWTLAHFAGAWDPLAQRAAFNSLRLAAGAALAVTLLGGLAAAWRRHRTGRLIGTASILTFAVPGSALGVAVLLAYGRWLRDSLLLILVAYVAKLWALGHRTIAGAVDGLPPDLLRAARASGAGPTAAARTVTLPLLRPAIGAAALVVFVFAFHELTMSSLLYGPGSQTLAVVILNLHQLGQVQTTAALAVLLTGAVLLAAAPLLLLRRRGWAWPQT